MTDFLDIAGASGTRYRFRRADFESLPVTAGNMLAVVGGPASPQVLVCAAARSLVRAAPAVREALKGAPATLFVRLNVARVQREAEHADIVQAVQPAHALDDLG